MSAKKKVPMPPTLPPPLTKCGPCEVPNLLAAKGTIKVYSGGGGSHLLLFALKTEPGGGGGEGREGK